MAQAAGTGRKASPERWAKAVQRAIDEDVRVVQVSSSGQWVATSGSKSGVAYTLSVTGDIAHGCDCLAGLNNDPVCKHRAAYYLLTGRLDPEPPAVAVAIAA